MFTSPGAYHLLQKQYCTSNIQYQKVILIIFVCLHSPSCDVYDNVLQDKPLITNHSSIAHSRTLHVITTIHGRNKISLPRHTPFPSSPHHSLMTNYTTHKHPQITKLLNHSSKNHLQTVLLCAKPANSLSPLLKNSLKRFMFCTKLLLEYVLPL